MSNADPLIDLAKRFLVPLRTHWWLWAAPAVVCTALALVYAIVGPRFWLASQQLTIRNESVGTTMNLGRFESTDVMKNALETLHAVVKNRQLAESVLSDVGAPADVKDASAWPSAEDVDDFLDSVSLTAPNGAVFGQTEVVQVNVKGESPERAIQLTTLLYDRMERRLNLLRAERSAGLVGELKSAEELAEKELTDANLQLSKIEKELGADLSELRNLDQQFTGTGGSLQLELGRSRELLEEAEREVRSLELKLKHLKSLQGNPTGNVSVPTSILQAHPSLEKLKQGLIDAELKQAEALGQYTETHPRSMLATQEVNEVRRRLQKELQAAVDEAAFDLQLALQKSEQLKGTQTQIQGRLAKLAEMRVEYNRRAAEVDQKKTDLADVSSQLSDAQALHRAAETTSIIDRLGDPVVSTHPIGPSRTMIVAGGMFCGLSLGVGLVFLVVNPPLETQANTEQPTAARSAEVSRTADEIANDDRRFSEDEVAADSIGDGEGEVGDEFDDEFDFDDEEPMTPFGPADRDFEFGTRADSIVRYELGDSEFTEAKVDDAKLCIAVRSTNSFNMATPATATKELSAAKTTVEVSAESEAAERSRAAAETGASATDASSARVESKKKSVQRSSAKPRRRTDEQTDKSPKEVADEKQDDSIRPRRAGEPAEESASKQDERDHDIDIVKALYELRKEMGGKNPLG